MSELLLKTKNSTDLILKFACQYLYYLSTFFRDTRVPEAGDWLPPRCKTRSKKRTTKIDFNLKGNPTRLPEGKYSPN